MFQEFHFDEDVFRNPDSGYLSRQKLFFCEKRSQKSSRLSCIPQTPLPALVMPAEDEEEDGADGEEEEEDGQDHDGNEVGVEGVLHGGGDDGGDGEGGLEEGEIAQRGLPVLQTTLDLGS